MKLIKNRKGAAFVTVLAVIMAITVLVITFSTISFWSYQTSARSVKKDKEEALVLSLVENLVEEISSQNDSALAKQLEKLNPEGTHKNEAVGTFEIGGQTGTVLLAFENEDKSIVRMTTTIGTTSLLVTFKRGYKSSITIEMEKIYSNTFFFENNQYWTQQMKVTGNLYLNSNSGMTVGTRENPHKGNVISCGNLELNAGSTIIGDVVVNGNLTLNANIQIEGKVQVKGNIEIYGNSSVRGKVTTYGTITNSSGIIVGDIYCNAYNFAVYSGHQIEGNLKYKTNLQILYGNATPQQVQRYFITGGAAKIERLESLTFPEPVKTEDWQAPILSENIVPINNRISASGVLDLSKTPIFANVDLTLDTTEKDLHITLKGDMNFARDIVIKGKNRAFIYVNSTLNLSGHIGKMPDMSSSSYPSKCRIFFISNGGYPTLKINSGSRLDGYVYFKKGEFYASGRGIDSGGVEYKIVGSICASNTHIQKDMSGEIVFCSPDLEDIIFNDKQNITESKVLVWNVERYYS